MRTPWVILLVVGALVLGAAVTAVALEGFEGSTESVPEIERPTATANEESSEASVELTERATLPPLPAPVARSAPIPERQRRTPVALSADREAANVPATELGNARDPSGSGEAFSLFRNTLVNKGAAIWIAEPNVASKDDRMMVVWNHGAAFSSDRGRTFTFVNPRRPEFPQDGGPYCCDQVVQYIPEYDLWVWFIQYYPPQGSGKNVIRLAFARGDAAFDARRFGYYDFTSDDFPNLGAGEFDLDYPNMSFTDRHLFLAINAYGGELYRTTVLLRVPLEPFADGEAFDYRYWLSAIGSGELAGGSDAMYFAQHVDTSILRVLTWPDDSDNPTTNDVTHTDYPYSFSPAFTCPREGAVGGDWCGRLRGGVVTNDDRPSSGWATDDEIGFSWNVPRAPARGFPYPYVHVLRIDRSTMTVKDEPIIWNPNHAYLWAALAPNGRGDLGGIVLSGGGRRYQTCATLIRDGASGDAWDARAVDSSDSDPDRSEAGDFLGVATVTPGGNTWVATCMTLHGGGSVGNVEIRLFAYGRAEDVED